MSKAPLPVRNCDKSQTKIGLLFFIVYRKDGFVNTDNQSAGKKEKS